MTDDPLDDPTDESGLSPSGPLLPPEDRIWRHPSELSASAGTLGSSVGQRWGTAAFSAVGGALAVGALWLAVGDANPQLVTERVSLAPIQTVTPRVVDADEWGSVVTETARSGTVSVISTETGSAIAVAFAYRDDGYLITSARALRGATSVMVVDSDGIEHEATVVGGDARTDVSVLRVEPPAAPVVVASAEVAVGDKLAIVDPEGGALESTVTDTAGHAATADGEPVLGVVTLDAGLGDIPPGSPAVDDTGAVVGLTTATDPAAGAALIPIDIARQVAGEIIDNGTASHSWLGITARNVTAEEIDGGSSPGVHVSYLSEDGPAAAAGILAGDVVVAVATKPVHSVSAMVNELNYHEPGEVVSIVVERDGEEITLPVVLGALDQIEG